MFDWVLDTSLTCLKKDKNCKKPIIFRNAAATTKEWFPRNFWEKLCWEMIFFTVFSASFVRNPEASSRGVVNSRATIFQESLALPFKNALTSGICTLG